MKPYVIPITIDWDLLRPSASCGFQDLPLDLMAEARAMANGPHPALARRVLAELFIKEESDGRK